MKFNEYNRELKLMRKQYGQEEELYPLINILLRETIICDTDVSIRAVAGARHAEKAAPGWKLFSGGGKGFPDIAILSTSACMNEYKALTEDCIRNSKKYLYGCVEAKSGALLEFKEDKSGVRYSVSYERKIQKRSTENGEYCCYNLKKQSDVNEKFINSLEERNNSGNWIESEKYKMIPCEEMWDVENTYKRTRASENIDRYRILEQFKLQSFNNSNNEEIVLDKEDVSELLNEIIWYEKVLYTNGTIWKYLELTSIELKGDEKWEREEFRWKYFKIEEILEQIKTITIKCFTICNLDLNASDDVNKKEWNRLKTNLSIINWTGETQFEKFK